MTVMLSEVVVDWLKHAFITKFNHIRPTVYERYMDVLCRDLASGSAVGRKRAVKVPALLKAHLWHKLMLHLSAHVCRPVAACCPPTRLRSHTNGCPERPSWRTECASALCSIGPIVCDIRKSDTGHVVVRR